MRRLRAPVRVGVTHRTNMSLFSSRTFDENMKVLEMKIINKELLEIDDKLYKSKGCDMLGYIYNRVLIKYFIG